MKRVWSYSKRLFPIAVVLGAIAVVSLSSLRDHDNTMAIDRVVSPEIANRLNHARQPSQLKLVFVGGDPVPIKNPERSYYQVRLALLNPTPFCLKYVGYTPDSYSTRPPRGEINPWYIVQTKIDDQWIEQPVERCGTGRDELAISPGQAGNFDAIVEGDGHVFRVGVCCKWVDQDGSLLESTIWSDDQASFSSVGIAPGDSEMKDALP